MRRLANTKLLGLTAVALVAPLVGRVAGLLQQIAIVCADAAEETPFVASDGEYGLYVYDWPAPGDRSYLVRITVADAWGGRWTICDRYDY